MKKKALLCSFVLSLISFSTAMVVSLLLARAGVVTPNDRGDEIVLFFISSIAVAPFFETLMIAALVGLAGRVADVAGMGSKAVRNVVVISSTSLFMFALHWLFSGWAAASILPAFYVFTFAYIKYRDNQGFFCGFVVSALAHLFHNLYGVVLLAIS